MARLQWEWELGALIGTIARYCHRRQHWLGTRLVGGQAWSVNDLWKAYTFWGPSDDVDSLGVFSEGGQIGDSAVETIGFNFPQL